MLNIIIRLSIKHKLIVGILTIILIFWGIWSANKLSVDALPDVTNNQVQVITRTPTLAAQEVEQFVTYPIEKSFANLPNLVEMRSFSRFGLSVITVVFEENVNIYFARQLIGEKLKEAQEQYRGAWAHLNLHRLLQVLEKFINMSFTLRKEVKTNTLQWTCEPCRTGLLPAS